MLENIITAPDIFCKPVSKYSFNAANPSPAERKNNRFPAITGLAVIDKHLVGTIAGNNGIPMDVTVSGSPAQDRGGRCG